MIFRLCLYMTIFFSVTVLASSVDPFKPMAQQYEKIREKQRLNRQEKKKTVNKNPKTLKIKAINQPYEVDRIIVNMVFSGGKVPYAKVNNYLIVRKGSFINSWKVTEIKDGCIYLEDGSTTRTACIGSNTVDSQIRPVK